MTRRGMGAAHEIWNYATLLMILGQLGGVARAGLADYRRPLNTFATTLSAVVGLHFCLLA